MALPDFLIAGDHAGNRVDNKSRSRPGRRALERHNCGKQ